MIVRAANRSDFAQLAVWNQQLQEDEGAAVMSLEAIENRLNQWLRADYRAVVFVAQTPVGYALFRSTNADSEGPGVYIRQFYIDRSQRRKGYGTAAFELLANEFLADHRVILEALESNPAGNEFWVSLGFEPYSIKYELKPA
jgi:ribosomal protein S18 acetylase RimI-like enzyme